MTDIPTLSELTHCTPLITENGRQLLDSLYHHPHAPRWNQVTGDLLTAADLAHVHAFAHALANGDRATTAGPQPNAAVMALLEKQKLIKNNKSWQSIPTLNREVLALQPDKIIPEDADWQRMVVYRTSGTTGHAILIPHHPAAVACYQPLISYALARYGIATSFTDQETACFLVGAQSSTVTYPTVLAAWGGAGFVKLNLNSREWPEADSPHHYFNEFAPRILTGDPLSFAEMLSLGITHRPAALVTTSVALSRGLKSRLEEAYAAPVVDWYSLTETGPMGYACPVGGGYHILPHDLFVEALDEAGRQVAPGQRGEITVTGGRNPYLPLLRYRTGDWGGLDTTPCPCGDVAPRLVDLEGRKPVVLVAADGGVVNPLEISRILREYPLVQHEFHQRADRSCVLRVRLLAKMFHMEPVRQSLQQLLGQVPLEIISDPTLGSRPGEGKVVPFRSDCLVEE